MDLQAGFLRPNPRTHGLVRAGGFLASATLGACTSRAKIWHNEYEGTMVISRKLESHSQSPPSRTAQYMVGHGCEYRHDTFVPEVSGSDAQDLRWGQLWT